MMESHFDAMPGSGKSTPAPAQLEHQRARTRRRLLRPAPRLPRRLPSPQKWLSYREQSILNRPLTQEEAEQFTHHTRRITSPPRGERGAG